MNSPCFDCLNRYGHSYVPECDDTCEFANIMSKLREFGTIDEILDVLKGDKFPLVFLDKDHIDFTYEIVCAAKEGLI